MALHDDGGYAGYIGRPLGEIFVPPAFAISFFNKMIEEPLDPVGLESEVSSLYEYEEFLGDENLKYSRVLHFVVTDPTTGEPIQEELYVPYIDDSFQQNDKEKFQTRPLSEVIDPRFIKSGPNVYIMYYFTNFNTEDLPSYTDDPEYLRRMVEFATNRPDNIAGNDPGGVAHDPYPNNRNYYLEDAPVDNNPKTAFMACTIRIVPLDTDLTSGSSSKRLYVIAERPEVITFIGDRFSLDHSPPLLVNKIQNLHWAEDSQDSALLPDETVEDNPPREIPYHHIISRISSVIYPGYMGINFYTRSIIDIYNMVLDYFLNGDDYYDQKKTNIPSGLLESIGFRKKTQTQLKYEEYDGYDKYYSNFDPFQRQFYILEFNEEDFRSLSSSSSSSSIPIFSLEIPESIYSFFMEGNEPEFWSYYWYNCSWESPYLTEIQMHSENGVDWYGEECIGNHMLYAKLEKKPYGYYNQERAKIKLTIGPLTFTGEPLDIVWQGFKVNNTDIYGNYERYYSLGDSVPDIIEVTEV